MIGRRVQTKYGVGTIVAWTNKFERIVQVKLDNGELLTHVPALECNFDPKPPIR